MIKKTCMAALLMASLQSYAAHPVITCDNYKESIIQHQTADYPNELSELDCSDDSKRSISYRAVLNDSNVRRPFNSRRTFLDDGRPIVDRSLIPLTDEAFIERYFPENDAYREMLPQSLLSKNEHNTFIMAYLIRKMVYIPNLSIDHMLSIADGDRCNQHEKEKIGMLYHSNIRKSHYSSTRDQSVQAWLIAACGQQPANLMILRVDDNDGSFHIHRQRVAAIDHSFTHFSGSEPYHEQTWNKIQDISPDGHTVLMQFVQENSDSSIDHNFNVVSQLTAIVYKNNKLYRLPTQKFINHLDYPRARLSPDGSKVAIASLKSVKLFEYHAAIDDYVLVGYYKHDGSSIFTPDSILMSPNGLYVYLYLDGSPYEVEFQK